LDAGISRSCGDALRSRGYDLFFLCWADRALEGGHVVLASEGARGVPAFASSIQTAFRQALRSLQNFGMSVSVGWPASIRITRISLDSPLKIGLETVSSRCRPLTRSCSSWWAPVRYLPTRSFITGTLTVSQVAPRQPSCQPSWIVRSRA